MKQRKLLFILAAVALVLGGLLRVNQSSGINQFLQNASNALKLPQLSDIANTPQSPATRHETKVVSEESVVIEVVENVSPAVVTIGIRTTNSPQNIFEINPFDPFNPYRQIPGREETVERDIGTGFIIREDGLIVTNRHVVSDPDGEYRVITNDDKTFEVVNIYRDQLLDLAIIKVDASGLPTVELGNSDDIKVGQMAIAIGTALGEFRHTVTTGVVSGVGRAIVAGSPFYGDSEELENVIQTDAAINPGNSGGPLLNSSGQVIGVNTAVSAQGENIGFAIPINIIHESIDNFNNTGEFDRAFLGVSYRTVTRELAVLNEIPEGAYVLEVIDGTSAQRAGIRQGDIITKIDGVRLTEENGGLAKAISGRKIGDRIDVVIYRGDSEQTVQVTLGSSQ